MRINMVDMFDATVESKKTEIAIKHNEEEITFYQLKNKALSVANFILSRAEESINRPIAVFLPKEIHTVV